jgi:hypothetical protein
MGSRVLQFLYVHRNMPGVFGNALRTNPGAEAFNVDVTRLSGGAGWTGVMVCTSYADNESLSIHEGTGGGFLALGGARNDDV